jgi:hypothetical protein
MGFDPSNDARLGSPISAPTFAFISAGVRGSTPKWRETAADRSSTASRLDSAA